MIEHKVTVNNEIVTIKVVEHEEELELFRDFIRRNLRCLAVDSETTGLDIYSDNFNCRLVQFGTATEAFVIPTEAGPMFKADVFKALQGVDKLILHNASFDLQVFDRTLGMPMEELWPKVIDTRILAHLVDPRGLEEGGIGHSLEDLTRHYIDSSVADNVKTLMTMLAKKYNTSKSEIWKIIPRTDPDYQLYAGMDTILASRLVKQLIPLVPAVSEKLIPYEHKIAEICAEMEKNGFLLDVEYTKGLSEHLEEEQIKYSKIASHFGCENVNSTEQVADVLESRGVRITGRTPTGKRKIDSNLLNKLISEGDVFAHAVLEAKKAGKWRKTWVDTFLREKDSSDRCHASINPLRARTARWSISGIPAQTLPSGDWIIRRCFLADPGHLITSVDYQAQELRVLAALSGDSVMRKAFEADKDLHQITADAAGVDRKVGKMANFLVVFGGGAGKLAKSANIDFPLAKRVLNSFNSTYASVAELSKTLQQEALETGAVITPFGRRLPVDSDRGYSSLNYVIQSTARDITSRAVVRLAELGYTPYIRLVIHDEVLLSLPEKQAVSGSKRIAQIMTEDLRGVSISTEPEVGNRSWGSCYGSDY